MEANNASESQLSNYDESCSSNTKVVPPPPSVVPAVQGQPWVAMQYPAPAMVMQPGLMPARPYRPRYMQYHNHSHPPSPPPLTPPHSSSSNSNEGGSNGENRTIWVGNLHDRMDENYLRNCFASTGEVSTVKIIYNKHTGVSEGYGFVEFCTRAAAEKVLLHYPQFSMPESDQCFRVNWAKFGISDKRSPYNYDLSIFVGDLAVDVTDALLHQTFASKYHSVKEAKVVIDANTGRSKGYGFICFGDNNEKLKAMVEMNGVYCSSRPMRIGAATPRKFHDYQHQYSSEGSSSNGASVYSSQFDGDSVNTTVFVGGLDPNVTDEVLRQLFAQYGEIVSVKIPVGKRCGFVQFVNRNNAEAALQHLNGVTIGQQIVRLSWGRNQVNRQMRADFGHQWMPAYYGGPFFDGYGCPLPFHYDPNMYAAAYGPYPMYGTCQQQVS